MKRTDVCGTPEQAARQFASFVLDRQPWWEGDEDFDSMELLAELLRITPNLDADERREALRVAEARLAKAGNAISAIREFAGPQRNADDATPALQVVGQ